MRGSTLKFLLLVAALVFAFAAVAAGCGGDGGGDDGEATQTEPGQEGEAEGGGTLVFGTAADPVVLDGALVSDGESLRAIDQMFEGLVTLEPGGTEIQPGLAESWEANDDGTSWTFQLREGVTFHDGEPFNAEAVCFNFDRWYNFPAPLQSPSASYYWQTVFGGFANPAEGSPGPDDSLYRSCEATDEHTVTLNLTRPSASFLGALALTNFTIASPKALQEFGADEGTVDEETGFRPTGTYGTEHPSGTGPFKFESWARGDRLVLVRNDDYWGEKAKIERLIFRPIPDNAARLQALQTGEIQGYDLVEPQDMETIENDDSLQLLDRPAFNVGYVGITQSHEPLGQLEVRQAIAHALNREQVVTDFYAGRGEVAHAFMPPDLFGYAEDVQQYEHDPERARELLQQAGVQTPVELTFCYPTDVSRPYMPDPRRNFEAFRANLEEAGFRITPRALPWSPDYLGAVDEGNCPLYLLGWTGDFADPDNFLGTFFQTQQKAWGFENQEIFDILDRAEVEPEEDARTELYQEANRLIMQFLPGVPYVHTKPALAFQACVEGYEPSPVSLETFNTVTLEGC
ncbi:MAG TPA: ABC transporter substrate-binding protein [Gaiellaceae bacterium]|nr:ABC transporter substrate-binding protein [Gaiellaceae bacterium]